jgi:hypothetical protein
MKERHHFIFHLKEKAIIALAVVPTEIFLLLLKK